MIVNQFKPEENKIEFSHRPGSIFYADFQSASFKQNGLHAWSLEIKLKMHPFRYLNNDAVVTLAGNGR